jgi:hypothetical protein
MATLPPLSLVAIYPHPARPPASSPAPRGGGGSRGDTRGKPHPGERTPARPFLQVPPHTLDRGDISTGVGQTGRGHALLPCLWLQYAGIPHPSRPFLQVPPHTLDRGDISTGGGADGGGMRLSPVSGCNIPPPRPASGLLPRPPGGQSWRDLGKAASGAYHQTLDREGHLHGGGADGGACASPLFLRSQYAGIPHPSRLVAPPPPPPGGGSHGET